MATNKQFLGATVLVAASVVLWWHPLIATFRLALSSEAHTHILLVVPLSVALIYVDRSRLQALRWRGAGWGGILLIAALLVRACLSWSDEYAQSGFRLPLSMFALVVWWVGSVVLCLGWETLRSLLFPICFLFLIVPIPDAVLAWIVQFLQHRSAAAAEILFRCAGVPVTRDGILLSIPNLDVEVAQECSSIRSSTMLVITTMVLAHLFLRSWWRKAGLVAVAVPLSIAKNGLRIFTIAELGTRVDPGFLDGRLHHNGGVVFLSVSVVAVLVLLWVLKWTEASGSSARRWAMRCLC